MNTVIYQYELNPYAKTDSTAKYKLHWEKKWQYETLSTAEDDENFTTEAKFI